MIIIIRNCPFRYGNIESSNKLADCSSKHRPYLLC